jgi:hypothetical protein
MSLSEIIPFVLLGIFVVLLPIAIIGVFASRLQPRDRTGLIVLYGAAICLLGVVVADVGESLPNRLIVDLVLLIGGICVGVYANRIVSRLRSTGLAGP